MAPLDGKYMTSYLIAIVCVLYLSTFKNYSQIKYNSNSLTLNMKVTVKEK